MTREAIAAALLVWLVGAVVGWCAGWVGRGEQNRAWHRGVVGRLALVRAELAEALDELDQVRRAGWETQRVAPPATSVVQVHVAAALPWAPPPQPPAVIDPARVLDAIAVGSAQQVTP